MTNQQIREKLAVWLSKTIDWRMTDFNETYVEAKVFAQANSVAGPAVWAILDAKYL